MTTSPASRRRWLWRLAGIVTASVLLVTAIDLLDAAARPPGGRRTLQLALAAPGSRVEELRLTMRIDAERLEARYELPLRRADALYEHVNRGDAERDVRGLVELLGGVTVDGRPLLFGVLERQGSGPQTTTLSIASASYPLSRRRIRVVVDPPAQPLYGEYCCLPPLALAVEAEPGPRAPVVTVADADAGRPIGPSRRFFPVVRPIAFDVEASPAAGRVDRVAQPSGAWSPLATGMVDWAALLDRRHPLKRFDLTVRAGRSITARYDLRVARDAPLLRRLQQGGALHDLRGLVELLGGVQVDGRLPPFEIPTIEEPRRQQEAAVSLRSRPVRIGKPRTPIMVPVLPARCCGAARRVVVATDGTQVVTTGSPAPTEQSRSRTVYGHADPYVAFDLLSRSPDQSAEAAAQPPADDQAPMADWRGSGHVAGALTLRLTIQKQQLTARYDLVLPPASPLREVLESGARDLKDELIELLGPISVDGEALSFRDPTTRLEQGRPDLTVSYESQPERLAQEEPRIRVLVPESQSLHACCVPAERFAFESDRADLLGVYGPAEVVQRSPNRAVFRQVTGRVDIELLQRGFDQKLAKPEQIDSLVRSLNEAYLPGLSPLLYWLAVALPLLVFLRWYRRGRLGSSPGHERSVQVVGVLLLLFAVVATASLLADLCDRWTPADLVVRRLQAWKKWPGGSPLSDWGATLLLVGAGLVWPALVGRWEADTMIWGPSGTPATPASGWTAARRRGVLLVLVAGAAVGLTVLADRIDAQLAGIGNANLEVRQWVAACVLASAALLYWLLAALRTRPRVLLVLLVACVLVAIPLAEAAEGADARVSGILRVMAVTAAGLALVAALVRVVCAAIPEAPVSTAVPLQRGSVARTIRDALVAAPPGRPGRRRRTGLRLLLVGAALLLVVPVTRWSGSPLSAVSGWTLFGLADWLSYVVYACVGYLVLRRLRELDGWQVDVGSRWTTKTLGLLLLLPLVFEPGQRILYLPLPLLVAYPIFQFWLLPQRPARQLAEAETLRRQRYSRSALVAAAVDAGHDRRALRAQRKELATKVGTGEITRAEYRTILGRSAQTPTLAGRRVHELGMSYGPSESSWANGLLFAGYALALSLPWIVVYYLHHELTGVLAGREYLVLGLIVQMLSSVLQWPLLGFFFGYFYPAIRGSNGLSKGLALTIAVIVPWLALNLAYAAIGDSGSWVEFGTWAAQVFVTCVLTGFLAGDLENLRRGGYGWSSLPDIHNFSALAAFGTSVLVASGGALVTLLTSTVGELVVQQFSIGGGKPPGGSP